MVETTARRPPWWPLEALSHVPRHAPVAGSAGWAWRAACQPRGKPVQAGAAREAAAARMARRRRFMRELEKGSGRDRRGNRWCRPQLRRGSAEGSGEGSEDGLDGSEVGEVAWVFEDLGVLDDAGFIDDEGGAFGDTCLAEIFVREEAVVGDAVGRGGGVVVVAEEGEGDVFFFGPCLLGEGVVAGDGEDAGVEGGEFVEAAGDFAEFLGADAGEGHGDEEEDDGGFAGVFGERDVFGAVGAEGGEFEVWGWGTCGESHGDGGIGGVLSELVEA